MHTHPLYFVLLLVAALCFALATFSVGVTVGRRVISLPALGLLAWVLVALIEIARS